MLDPLDRHSRDSTLFQFTTKRMRDFIDPKHLLIQIEEQFDFQKLVEPVEAYYCRVNLQVVVPTQYGISSQRRSQSGKNGCSYTCQATLSSIWLGFWMAE